MLRAAHINTHMHMHAHAYTLAFNSTSVHMIVRVGSWHCTRPPPKSPPALRPRPHLTPPTPPTTTQQLKKQPRPSPTPSPHDAGPPVPPLTPQLPTRPPPPLPTPPLRAPDPATPAAPAQGQACARAAAGWASSSSSSSSSSKGAALAMHGVLGAPATHGLPPQSCPSCPQLLSACIRLVDKELLGGAVGTAGARACIACGVVLLAHTERHRRQH